MARGRSIVAAICGIAMVAGCASADGDDRRLTALHWEDLVLEPQGSVDAPLMSQPVVLADTVVAYTSPAPDVLELTGWSLEDDGGGALWSVAADPGRVAPGVALRVATAEVDGAHVAAALRQVTIDGITGELHHPVLVDVSSGNELEVDGLDGLVFQARSRPEPCDDAPSDEAQICIVGVGLGEALTLRVSLGTDEGRLTAAVQAEPTTEDNLDARPVGANLWSTLARPPGGVEVLQYVLDDEVLWSRAYEDIFGPGYTTDLGWAWREHDDLVIGWARGADPDELRAWRADEVGSLTLPLPDLVTVALDIDTGETRWRLDGVQLWCGAVGASWDVGCAYLAGSITMSDDPNANWVPADLDIELVRIDLGTGEQIWTVPVHDSDALFDGWAAGSAEFALIDDSAGVHLIDLESGESRALDWPSYPCEELVEYTQADSDDPWLGGYLTRLCDADGGVVETNEVTAGLLEIVGVDAGERGWLLAGPDGLTRYVLPTLSGTEPAPSGDG